MNRVILGAVSALLLAGAGLFWWQGQASINASAPPPQQLSEPEASGLPLEELPDEDGEGLQGPSLPPGISEASREEKRFNRLDRNRDNVITRVEMLQPRIAALVGIRGQVRDPPHLSQARCEGAPDREV